MSDLSTGSLDTSRQPSRGATTVNVRGLENDSEAVGAAVPRSPADSGFKAIASDTEARAKSAVQAVNMKHGFAYRKNTHGSLED